ncbi:hypothetical protein ACROYT_G039333 [Oculina patagonica]
MCVEETLDCNQKVPTIFKLGDQSCACNRPAHAGALKYTNGKIYVCLGSKWKTVVLEDEYGTENIPGLSCKDILNKAGQHELSNGVYWIHLQGSQDSFPVYCDMASGGWTLVFKVVSGVDRKVWDLYNSNQASAELVTAALDVTNRHKDHYKNRVVMNWQTFNPSQAKVILYEGAVAKKKLVFDASGTNKLNWFSVDKLKNSPWTDVEGALGKPALLTGTKSCTASGPPIPNGAQTLMLQLQMCLQFSCNKN